MANRTSSFTVEIAAVPDWEAVWTGDVYDSEGSRGPGSHMHIVGNDLQMIGRAIGEFVDYRKMHSHLPEAKRYLKRKNDKARKRSKMEQAR